VAGDCVAGLKSRRKLLDVQLEQGVEDAMLSRALQRATEDERWARVARVLVHLGACVNASTSNGRSLLLFALEQADQGRRGFRELVAMLLDKLGEGVDQWETPTFLIEDRTAECPICFETLWTSTPTAFTSFAKASGGREGAPHVICAHFFCFDCASQQYMKQASKQSGEYHCPLCRASAHEVMPLPDITVNPRLWFQFLDAECTGRIDRNTIVQALEAMLPLDTENLREAMQEHCWSGWDKSQDDCMGESDFFSPGGLLEWVRGHQHELQSSKARGPAPPLDKSEDWFRHWDSDKRGRLRRGEVLRAICEAARVSSLEMNRVRQLKKAVEAVWEQHASPDGTISRERFLEGGVADALAKVASGNQEA